MSTISESKEQSDLEVQAQKISFVLEQLLLLARTETSNWRASVDTLTSCEGAIDQLERTLTKRSLSCEFCEGLRNELHTIQTLIERLPPSSGTDFCGHRGMRSPRHRGSHHPTGEQDSKYKSNTVESIEHECEGSSGIRTPTTSVRHAVLARSETQRPSTHRSPRSKKNMSPATSPRVIRVPPLTELMDHAACSGPQSKSPFRLSQASHRAHCPACLARRCRRAQPAACSPEPERSASAGMKSPRKSNRSRSVFARDTTMTSYHVTKMRVGTSRAEELIRSVGVNSNCVNIAQVEIEIQTLEKRQHPRLIRYFCLERQESETSHICPHSFDAGSSLTSIPQVQYRLLKEISPRGSMTLTKFLQKRRADGVPLSNMEMCWFVYDIAQAVAHLHRLDIVHGALLPSCALVTHEKLQGQHILRCVVDWYGSMTGQLEPNDKFRSPESLNATEEQRSQEEDMWCLGMLSVYIFTQGTFRDPPTAKERSEGRNTSVTTNSTSPVSPGLPNRPACCPPQIWDDAISLCFEPKDLRIRALDFVQAFQYYVRPPWEA